VLLRPPERPPAQARRKLEAAVRRHGAVLLVAGEWEGAQVRLRISAQEWFGIGSGHGRLRGRRAQVVADGRGGWSRSQARWLWLPGPDGAVTALADAPAAVADPATAGPATAGPATAGPATAGPAPDDWATAGWTTDGWAADGWTADGWAADGWAADGWAADGTPAARATG
jgi:hypothetical protein